MNCERFDEFSIFWNMCGFFCFFKYVKLDDIHIVFASKSFKDFVVSLGWNGMVKPVVVGY